MISHTPVCTRVNEMDIFLQFIRPNDSNTYWHAGSPYHWHRWYGIVSSYRISEIPWPSCRFGMKSLELHCRKPGVWFVYDNWRNSTSPWLITMQSHWLIINGTIWSVSDVKEHVALTKTGNDSTPLQQGYSGHSVTLLWMTYKWHWTSGPAPWSNRYGTVVKLNCRLPPIDRLLLL